MTSNPNAMGEQEAAVRNILERLQTDARGTADRALSSSWSNHYVSCGGRVKRAPSLSQYDDDWDESNCQPIAPRTLKI